MKNNIEQLRSLILILRAGAVNNSVDIWETVARRRGRAMEDCELMLEGIIRDQQSGESDIVTKLNEIISILKEK